MYTKLSSELEGSILVSPIPEGKLSVPSVTQTESKYVKSKNKISKIMKHYVQTIAIIAMVITVFSLSSCNKEEAKLPEEQNHSALMQAESVSDMTARPVAMQSNGFHTIGAPAAPSQGDLGTSFRFTFKGSPADGFEGFDLYVRFTAPDGTQYPPISMRKSGREGNYLVFTLDRVLQQAGQYRFEYVYYYNGSYRPMLGTSSQTLKVIQQSIPLGDDYNRNNDSSYVDNYCTAWVAWKVNQMWGTWNGFPSGLGYARDWKQSLENRGYTSSTVPQVGDIAWWKEMRGSSCVYQGRPCGHVAFVNKVLNNGAIEITEYNGTKRLEYSTRIIEKNGRYSYPEAFIHVQNKK